MGKNDQIDDDDSENDVEGKRPATHKLRMRFHE